MKRTGFIFNVVVLIFISSIFSISGFSNPEKVSLSESVEEGVKKRIPLKLDYVANAGVLLTAGKTKILMDAVYSKPHPDLRAPAPEVLAKIIKGEAPFDNISLFLVTHKHPDHFEAELVSQYLENNKSTILLLPRDGQKELEEKAGNWGLIKERVISFNMEPGDIGEKDIREVSLKVLRTKHSGNRMEPQNLVYLFRIHGWTIIHEGDSNLEKDMCGPLNIKKGEIDLALVHFWFPLHPQTSKMLQDKWDPNHIALTHLLKRLENNSPKNIEMVRNQYKDIFLLLPGFETKTFSD